MPLTPSLRHCSNKYKLARGEKDEDFEKVKDFFFFFLSSQVELKESKYYHLERKLTLCTDHAPIQWMAHAKDRARVANANADCLSRLFAGWSGLVRDTIIQLASLLAMAITSASSTDWRQAVLNQLIKRREM